MEILFNNIDGSENKYIDFRKNICLVESNSRDKNAINNVNDIIEKFSLSEGFSVNRISFENAGDYMIVDMNKDSDKGCLFIAHTDTAESAVQLIRDINMPNVGLYWQQSSMISYDDVETLKKIIN